MGPHREMLAKFILVALAAATLLACNRSAARAEPESGATGKLAGEYQARATNPGGQGSYDTQVSISRTGAYYSLSWKIGKERTYRGVGIEFPGFLGAGWGLEGYQVFVYEISGSELRGRWAGADNKGKLGSERLQGGSTLNGNFEIVEGYDPVLGEHYDGSISLAPNGAIYRVQRTTSHHKPLGGVGIKKGNRLIVGFGPGGGAGVTVYTLKPKGLSGQWAQPTSNLLGTEFLTQR